MSGEPVAGKTRRWRLHPAVALMVALAVDAGYIAWPGRPAPATRIVYGPWASPETEVYSDVSGPLACWWAGGHWGKVVFARPGDLAGFEDACRVRPP